MSGVLERSQGYCLGLAAVYLTVAERIGLPIHAVGTPSHVFLRYDDGSTRINIETMSGGASVADEEYIDRQRIAPESIRKGVFLRRLSTERFLAQVCNNLGVIYSERKDPVRAAAEYEKALALDPRLPAAWYNLGKDAMTQNRPKEAVRAFTKTIALHPNDTWALNNRGIAFSRLDKRAKARADFEAALRIDPGFEQARAGLASLAVP